LPPAQGAVTNNPQLTCPQAAGMAPTGCGAGTPRVLTRHTRDADRVEGDP
jgi:hypothetical protein